MIPSFENQEVMLTFSPHGDYQFLQTEGKTKMEEEEDLSGNFKTLLSFSQAQFQAKLNLLKNPRDNKKREKILPKRDRENLILPSVIHAVENGYSQKDLGEFFGVNVKRINQAMKKRKKK